MSEQGPPDETSSVTLWRLKQMEETQKEAKQERVDLDRKLGDLWRIVDGINQIMVRLDVDKITRVIEFYDTQNEDSMDLRRLLRNSFVTMVTVGIVGPVLVILAAKKFGL